MAADGWDAPELADEQPDEAFLELADPRSLDEQLTHHFDRGVYGSAALGSPWSPTVSRSRPLVRSLLRIAAAAALLLLLAGVLASILGWNR